MSVSILIVDDSAVMRKMIKKTLIMGGMELNQVFEASNGLEGLACLKEHPIDLMLIDMNMPVMDGLEMLEKVKADPETRGIPALIISTESNEQRISAIYKLEASFVHKPFSPEEVVSEIRLLL